MNEKIQSFAEMLRESERIVFFGGAGVSTESGVKDYRSKDGLYNTVKEYGVSPETILSHSFFYEQPEVFYDFFRKYFMVNAEPNAAHKALAALEEMGKMRAVITQNIDGLHQCAGSENVIELHGTASVFFCAQCKRSAPGLEVLSEIAAGGVPKCEHCGGVMRPKVVFYEEPLYEGVADRAVDAMLEADMLIVGGTSLAVYPAASFIDYFRGKYIVVINKSETGLDGRADLVFSDSIGKVFSEAMALLKE